jgi:hypothetical protein
MFVEIPLFYLVHMLEYIKYPISKCNLHSVCRTGTVTCCICYARRTRNFFPLLLFSVNEKDMTSSILFKKWIGEIKVEIRFNLDSPDRDT